MNTMNHLLGGELNSNSGWLLKISLLFFLSKIISVFTQNIYIFII